MRKLRASTVGATEQLTPRVPENIVESETNMQESTAVPPSAISETYDILSMQKQDIAMCYKKKMTTINGGT